MQVTSPPLITTICPYCDKLHTAASVHFYCTSSGISKHSLHVLSEGLCVSGKQSAFSDCYPTSPPPTASTDFPLKAEERGRKRNSEINPTIR